MEAVIESCESGKNALLESPTGTGKTLSLLCSTLAWVKSKRETSKDALGMRVLYLSRTHSQLMQVVRELKKTIYAPVTTTLGSRDQLCINTTLGQIKGAQLNLTCKKLKKLRFCPHYRPKAERAPELKEKILDLEELFEYGKARSVCPYYAARELTCHADLVLMPYNYILDYHIRSRTKGLQYGNAVIIFDEAHNVHRVAEEASSFEISVGAMRKCLEEIRHVRKIWQSLQDGEVVYSDMKKEVSDLNGNELAFIEETIHHFINYLQNLNVEGLEKTVYEGRKLFEIFLEGTSAPKEKAKPSSHVMSYTSIEKYLKKDGSAGTAKTAGPEETKAAVQVPGQHGGITIENSHIYTQILQKCVEALSAKSSGSHLDMWCKLVGTVFHYMLQDRNAQIACPVVSQQQLIEKHIDDFKVIICEESDILGHAGDEPPARDLNNPRRRNEACIKAYCFNPAVAFADILKAKPRTIILTSGTLSPMAALESELRISFPIKLESPHVIERDQVLMQIITHDTHGHPFNFNYKLREGQLQLESLGELIQEICTVTPGGILTFFSCYTMLVHCCDAWKASVIPAIERKTQKKVFKEQRKSSQNQTVLKGYRSRILAGKGAILFAVCRGKISEGLDFADEAARMVIVIGIPYPSLADRRVNIKREYLDEHKEQLRISGKDWYMQEAVRAVNQSIGRAIRHRYDYGSILLVDERFDSGEVKSLISRWLRDSVTKAATTKACVESLARFYETMRRRCLPQLPSLQPENPFKTRLTGGGRGERRTNKSFLRRFGEALNSNDPSGGFSAVTSMLASAAHLEPRVSVNQLDSYFLRTPARAYMPNFERASKRRRTEVVSCAGTAFAVSTFEPAATRPRETAKTGPAAVQAQRSEQPEAKKNSLVALNERICALMGKGGARQLYNVMQKQYKQETKDITGLAREVLELCKANFVNTQMQDNFGGLLRLTAQLVKTEDRADYVRTLDTLSGANKLL